MSTASDNDNKSMLLSRIKARHPDRVPVLVNRKEGSNLPLPANTK